MNECTDRLGQVTRLGDIVIWAAKKSGAMGKGTLEKIHSGRVTIRENGRAHVLPMYRFIKVEPVNVTVVADPNCPKNKAYWWQTLNPVNIPLIPNTLGLGGKWC